MRIHHVSVATTGQVWRVTPQGVRPVLIRHWPTVTLAAVSLRQGVLIAGLRDWAPNTNDAAIADLFLVEQDARVEHSLRRGATRAAALAAVGRDPGPVADAQQTAAFVGAVVSLVCAWLI